MTQGFIAIEGKGLTEIKGLTAIDGEGEVLWQVSTTTVDAVSVTETTVYCAMPYRSEIHAVDAKTGEALWQLPISADYFIGEKGVLVFGTQYQLFAISPKPRGLPPEQEAYMSLLGIGTAQVALGHYEAAIPPLKEALELRSDLAEAHWQLMRTYEGLGQWDQAAASRNAYLSLVPYEQASPDVKRHLWERQGIRWGTAGGYLFATDKRLFIDGYPFEPRTGTKLWKNIDSTRISPHERVKAVTEQGVYYRTDEHMSPRSVSCRSLSTGELLWQRKSWQTMSASEVDWAKTFAIADGQMYVELFAATEVADRGKERQYRVTSILYALDGLTGETRWTFSVDRGLHTARYGWPDDLWQYRRGAPLAVADLVYWLVEGQLYALDPATGTVQWQFATSDAEAKRFPEETSVAVSEGVVCIGIKKKIYGLNARTGKLKWESPIRGLFLRSTPLGIKNGRVYALAYDETPSLPPGDSWGGGWSLGLDEWTGYLIAIRTESGEVDWLLKLSFHHWDNYGIRYVLDGEVIYLRLPHDVLYAVSAATGEIRWQFPYRNEQLILGEKTVYVRGNGFYALDKATGAVKWVDEGFGGWGIDSLEPNGYGVESDGFLYLNSGSEVYAFDLRQIDKLRAEGKQWWTEPKER